MKILVVDDEKSIADIIKYGLEKEGYEVLTAGDGEEALNLVKKDNFDLILLDIMMPGKDGLEVCREISLSPEKLPVIMLTAKDTEIDKVVGLELGADDYITKPFSMREVVARVKAVLRRTAESKNMRGEKIVNGDLKIDLQRMEVLKNNKSVEVTFREFTLLAYLMQRRNHIFSREKLLDAVWGYDYTGEERTVDVMIRRLREKIEDNPAHPDYIVTKRGIGYYFRGKENV